jgi:hypothetical protein
VLLNFGRCSVSAMLAFMARNEQHREDLLREATALVERVEIASAGKDAKPHIVAGFRADGSFSVYFGDDPVYQFNATGKLRRAFCNGHLVKAVAGRLAALERIRRVRETELRRHDLSPAEETEFLRRLADAMAQFESQLASGGFRLVGEVPPDADVIKRIRQWLKARRDWPIAESPRLR